MGKGRLEAFSDGVLAILITIMVLELRPPEGHRFADLLPLWPKLGGYILSFIYLGIYWNNHHHMLHAAKRITGASMWANHHLLFWLSLVPAVTAWADESHFATAPMAAYGIVLFMSGAAYSILQRTLTRDHDPDSVLARAFRRDWKGTSSVALYVVGTLVAFVSPWVSGAIYVSVALMWLIPDRRIERELKRADSHPEV